MGIEVATYVSDLVDTNPLAGDLKSQGDDHLRLLKAVLKGTFPNADRAFRLPEIATKTTTGSLATTDDQKLILVDTSGGAVTLTLPTPTIDGWCVTVMKLTGDVNAVTVAPPSGTINGAANLTIPTIYGYRTFFWDGSAFWAITPYSSLTIDGYAIGTSGAKLPLLNGKNTWTYVQAPTASALTSSVAADFSTSQCWTAAISGAFTISNPSADPPTGSYVSVIISMTASGTVSWGAKFKGLANYTQSTWASGTMRDHLVFRFDGTNYDMVAVTNGVNQ